MQILSCRETSRDSSLVDVKDVSNTALKDVKSIGSYLVSKFSRRIRA